MALQLKNTLARIFQVLTPVSDSEGLAVERRDSSRRPSYQTALVEWHDMEKGEQALAGRLENRSRTGFGLHTPRRIAKGKAILVTPEEERPIKAIVRNCSADESGWYIGVELVPHEKRRIDREPMHYAARVTCTRGGRGGDLDVIIKDASEGGLQLESPVPLVVDQRIEVSHLSASREGVVAHCNPHDDAYRLGIQFIGPARPADRVN